MIATLLMLVALATVIVVVATKDADILSVVALSLAILAFIAQLLVFVIQETSGATQRVRAQELHGATMAALASIEEKSEGTKQMVNTLQDRVLQSLLQKGIAPGEVNESSALGLATLSSPELNVAFTPVSSGDAARSATPKKKWDPLQVPNGQRREMAVSALEALDEDEVDELIGLAEDHLEFQESSLGPGIKFVSRPTRLMEKGLIKRIRRDWSKVPLFVLTELGRDVAALLVLPDIDAAEDAVLRGRSVVQRLRSRNAERADLDHFPDLPVQPD